MSRGKKYSFWRRAGSESGMPGSSAPATRSLRGLSTLLVGTIFSLALITILGSGNPPLPYRRGQVVTSEIKSRVQFSIINDKATKAAKDAAAASTPNVYRVDRLPLERTLANLKEALGIVHASSQYEDIDPSRIQSLSITPEFYTAVKGMGPETTDEKLLQAASTTYESIVKQGALSQSDAKIERDRSQASGIIIIDGAEKRYQPLSALIRQEDMPATLRAALRQELPGNITLAAALALHLAPMRVFLIPDDAETAKDKKLAADRTPEIIDTIFPNDTMVRSDTLLDRPEIMMLEKEHQEYLKNIPIRDRLWRLTGLAITVTFLVWLFGAYISRYEPRILTRRARMVVLMLLAVALVVVTRFFVRSSLSWYLIPLSLFTMAVAIAYDSLFAIGYALFLTILLGIATGSNFALSISLFLGATVGVLVMGRARTRTTPFLSGLAAGGGTFVAAWGTGLLLHADYTLTMKDSFYGFMNGVASGVLITVLLPYVERGFNVVTELSLLELVDLNKPILRRLALEAPGTYNHSLFVGNLADAAAEGVGANQLLARAGGYYHDIGKLAKSGYFVENAGTAASRHYNLSPTMSALVIISHVKDAAELAKEYRLPPPVADIIKEHHGTTLVEYFYHEAVEQAAQSGETRKVDDGSFRYPGPKPRSKEAAIVMLSDCVESASRTVTDPTPGKLENLVHDIARGKLADGQFDECNLTMAELRLIETSLIKSLAGIFHSRIKYPGRDL